MNLNLDCPVVPEKGAQLLPDTRRIGLLSSTDLRAASCTFRLCREPVVGSRPAASVRATCFFRRWLTFAAELQSGDLLEHIPVAVVVGDGDEVVVLAERRFSQHVRNFGFGIFR